MQTKERVELIWNDASSTDCPDEANQLLCIQKTMGYLIRHDKHLIVIARDYNSLTDDYEVFLRIPFHMKIDLISLDKE